MSVEVTDYGAHLAINLLLRNSGTSPTTVYAALGTAHNSSGLTSEVSGGGYSRVAVTFDAPASRATDNGSTVDFGTTTGSWGTVTSVAIYDAATSGNCLAVGSLTASKVINSGDPVYFSAGELDFAFNAYSD